MEEVDQLLVEFGLDACQKQLFYFEVEESNHFDNVTRNTCC
jgi:hypothetical protein